MRRPRLPAAFLLVVLLSALPMVAAANCCPPADAASPAVAAAGCCGQCPTTLTPEPEPASLSLKASSPAPAPAVAPASAETVPGPLEGSAAARFPRSCLEFPPRLAPLPLRI